jgi:hypothetical protein
MKFMEMINRYNILLIDNELLYSRFILDFWRTEIKNVLLIFIKYCTVKQFIVFRGNTLYCFGIDSSSLK